MCLSGGKVIKIAPWRLTNKVRQRYRPNAFLRVTTKCGQLKKTRRAFGKLCPSATTQARSKKSTSKFHKYPETQPMKRKASAFVQFVTSIKKLIQPMKRTALTFVQFGAWGMTLFGGFYSNIA